ncbi:MAG: MBL fold metallo-hydrolase [Acidimicrobiales bacterium]|nr:MBL fold metallo-hydrolase [Acidimicrobiales bacterium]
MHRWQVGEIEVVRVEDASFALPTDHDVPGWMVPAFAPTSREIGIAFSALGIRVGDHRIVVDPWLADDGPRDQPDAAAHVARLLDELAAAGFPAAEVDTVVNTHIDGIGWNTRPDDVGWVPTFPNARYLFPSAELDAVAAGDGVYGGEHVAPLIEAGLVEPVPAGSARGIAPGVTVVDAPGHNAGHVAVRVESAGALAVIPGHLVLTPIQVEDPAHDVGESTHAVGTATRRELLSELADRRGLLVTTLLGGPGGGRVETEGDGYRLVVD